MVFSLGSFDGLTNIFILSKKIFRDLVATKNYHFVLESCCLHLARILYCITADAV